VGTGTWVTIATATTGPYGATWNSKSVPDGAYDLDVVTTDNAGNSFRGRAVSVQVRNTTLKFTTGKIKLAADGKTAFLKAPVVTSDAVKITTTLMRGKGAVSRWVNSVAAGATILNLRLQRSKLKQGIDRLVMAAMTADGRHIRLLIRVRITKDVAAPAPASAATIASHSGGANLRAHSTMESLSLGWMPNGSIVSLICWQDNEWVYPPRTNYASRRWLQVEVPSLGGSIGWVHSRLIANRIGTHRCTASDPLGPF